MQIKTSSFKLIGGWIAVFLVRLIPMRPPNVEPMLAAVMPFSKRYSGVTSFLFGFLGIALYDAVTSGWGIWTLVSGLMYGVLGLAAHLYFKGHDATAKHFAAFGVLATLAYDAVTGLLVGPLAFHQSFVTALVGQIPFTLMHLTGTVLFATLLSPALYRWVSSESVFSLSASPRALEA